MATVYIAIGTNLGDREAHIEHARKGIAALPGTRVVAMAPIYETPPVGPVDQDAFLNSAICIETDIAPLPLLEELNRLEREAGRADPKQRRHWGPRELDLDILLYDQQAIDQDRLTIPHPLMHEREFVLRPLADIAPDVLHPIMKRSIAELLADLPNDTQ